MSPTLIVLLIVLAAAVGTGAYIGARRYLDQPTSTSTAGPGGSQATGPDPITATGAGGTCPQFTVDAVKQAGGPGKLQRLLYVQATRTGTPGAEAWICKDSDGVLYYQGHNKAGPSNAATSDSTILLGSRVKGSVSVSGETGANGTYTATNPTSDGSTQYVVSRAILSVISPNGARTDYTVTLAQP